MYLGLDAGCMSLGKESTCSSLSLLSLEWGWLGGGGGVGVTVSIKWDNGCEISVSQYSLTSFSQATGTRCRGVGWWKPTEFVYLSLTNPGCRDCQAGPAESLRKHVPLDAKGGGVFLHLLLNSNQHRTLKGKNKKQTKPKPHKHLFSMTNKNSVT